MEREYYLIEDAAKKIGCTSSDLIHYGALGRLDLYALMPGCMAKGRFWDGDPAENEYAEEQEPCGEYEDGNYPLRRQLTGSYLLSKFDIQRIEAGDRKSLAYITEKFSEGSGLTAWELDEPIPLLDLKIVVLPKDISKLISDKPEQPEPKNVQAGALVATPTSDTGKDDEEAPDDDESIVTKAPQDADERIADLFDPVSQAAIKILFDKVDKVDKVDADVWKKYFDHAARNGLSDARQGDAQPFQYNPAKVADWLVSKGKYTRAHADRKLVNNLPERSKDKKYLITGDIE